MPHPTQELLLGFLAGSVDESVAERLFAHLDGCPTCHERLVVLRRIREDVDGALSRFEQESRLRAARRAEVEASPASPRLALRGILDATRQMASAALDRTREIAAGFDAVFVPAFAGTGDPSGLGEAGVLAGEAAAACAEARDEDALTLLAEATATHPEAAREATLEIHWSGRVVGAMVVDARLRKLSVMIEDREFLESRPGLLLEAGGETRTLELRPVPGAAYYLAETESLPDGAFQIHFL